MHYLYKQKQYNPWRLSIIFAIEIIYIGCLPYLNFKQAGVLFAALIIIYILSPLLFFKITYKHSRHPIYNLAKGRFIWIEMRSNKMNIAITCISIVIGSMALFIGDRSTLLEYVLIYLLILSRLGLLFMYSQFSKFYRSTTNWQLFIGSDNI